MGWWVGWWAQGVAGGLEGALARERARGLTSARSPGFPESGAGEKFERWGMKESSGP